MKLESLKSSKFEAFKGMEVKNPLLVVGGLTRPTGCDVNGENATDRYEWFNDQADMTGKNVHVPGTPGNGNNGDYIAITSTGPIWGDPYSQEMQQLYHISNIHVTGPDMP